MGAGVWGWNPQLGDESPPVWLARSGRNNFRKKKVFWKNVIRTKIFVHLYGLFFVRISFEIWVFFERTLIRKNGLKKNLKERNSKEKNEFRKNVIRSNDLVPSSVMNYYVTTKVTFCNSNVVLKDIIISNWLTITLHIFLYFRNFFRKLIFRMP